MNHRCCTSSIYRPATARLLKWSAATYLAMGFWFNPLGAGLAEYVLLEDFDALSAGPIDGQSSTGAWSGHGGVWKTSNRNTGGVKVLKDPTPGARSDNHVLLVVGLRDGSDSRTGGLGRESGAEGGGSRIGPDESGTLYFRFIARGANPNTFVGLSARDVAKAGVHTTTGVDAIEAGFGVRATSPRNDSKVALVAPDGETVLGQVDVDRWYDTWIVVGRNPSGEEGEADVYDIHVRPSGTADTPLQVATNQPFHSSTGFQIKSVLFCGGAGVPERTGVLFDSLYWDGDEANLSDPATPASDTPH